MIDEKINLYEFTRRYLLVEYNQLTEMEKERIKSIATGLALIFERARNRRWN